ncbi:hypothetical protein BDR26DRAFT_919615 [Obelidium mucronatum]|nr:hypothetical protein BDR26DRAFT_919615 [Obelidium mucronatum]
MILLSLPLQPPHAPQPQPRLVLEQKQKQVQQHTPPLVLKKRSTRDQSFQLLSLPERQHDETFAHQTPNRQCQESLSHLLAHAQTRIRHLTALVRAPMYPHQTSIEVQTDPKAKLVNPNKSARNARRSRKNPTTTTAKEQHISPDTNDDDEISWETIDANEYNLIQEQWWHDFCTDNDALGSRREIHGVDPCSTPRDEEEGNFWESRKNRRLLVAQVAKPIWLEGATWTQVKESIGILSNSTSSSSSCKSGDQTKLFTKRLPLGEDDGVMESLERFQRHTGKWRTIKDKRTKKIHRELVLDRIHDSCSLSVTKKFLALEDQERELIADIETTENSQNKWNDWISLVRTTAARVASEKEPPNPFASEKAQQNKLTNTKQDTTTANQTLSQKLNHMKKEDSTIKGALFELMKRHAQMENSLKFQGTKGFFKAGVVGSDYLEKVWNAASSTDPPVGNYHNIFINNKLSQK